MKIALVGNMNNNFFSLLRYFRDLGLDAYLLLYSNELSHFLPENDTWELDKWKPYIKQLDIVNGSLKSYFKYSRDYLRKQFVGYDYYIVNGFSPALFRKAGLNIDLFLPYCVGIEYTYFYNKSTLRESLAEILFNRLQVKGLKNNVHLIGTIDEDSLVKAKKYGIPTVNLAMPMVYLEKSKDLNLHRFNNIIHTLREYDLVIFTHVSHFPSGSDGFDIKRNDIGIKGFAEHINNNRNHTRNSVLVLLDYGPGVSESKELIRNLGIEHAVIWLPQMTRKEIIFILQETTFGFGEFGGHLWGGTVWEFMAVGKPFFQFVDLDHDKLSKLLGCEPPIFHNTNNPEEIADVLDGYYIDNTQSKIDGENLKKWYNTYNGLKLAERYKDIIMDKADNKK